MVPEEMVERPAVHGEWRLERASVVVILLSSHFERYAARAVVDAHLTSAVTEVEENVVDVDWSVEKAVDALATEFVILQAYQL